MLLRRIYDAQLAQASYLVGCRERGEAIVIDPTCDIDRYLAEAARESLRIVAVAETHVHADFVSGVCGFLAHHPVRAYVSAEGPDAAWMTATRLAAGAEIVRIHAGDSFRVGNLDFTARHTPGHTRESLSFELSSTRRGTKLFFSGDFLFAGDVGRPDLGAFATDGMTLREAVDRLRDSLASLVDLPEDTQVLPGHGAGSECGRAICNIPATTIGIERVINRALRSHGDAGGFEQAVLDGAAEPPPYFARVKKLNESGARVIMEPPAVPELAPGDFAARCENPSYTVIDTRPWNDFLDMRLPYAISAPFERSFGPTVANYLEEDDRIVLIAAREKVSEIVRVLLRVGVAPESIEGFVEPAAVAALATGTFVTDGVDDISPVRVHDLVEQGAATIVDVRTCAEFAAGHLPGARHIPYTHLRARAAELDPAKPVVCDCRSGNRSARAAAYLARAGFHAHNMRGGYWPYAGRGYAVER
ncbi:MAG: MBL fold metallo-hydrolase [Planctomycetota bacterium]